MAAGQRRRFTVVIGGQSRRSTTVNAAGHRSTPADHGGDRRSTTVADGEPPLTAAGPPLTTTGPPVNGGWWAGQRAGLGLVWIGSGLGPGRVRHVACHVSATCAHVSATCAHVAADVDIKHQWESNLKEILQVETKEGESWMTLIHKYLVSGLLPEDPKESRKIRVKAPQYKLIRGNMYRRSFYTPRLHCVASPETDDNVKEVHEGSCGFNAEPRSMVVRITNLTYGSEAIILIPENDVAKDDRGRIKEVDKRRGNKEIASIEEAYYQSKLRRHHSEKSSHSIYKI
nr:reverse transcriptase domain-containing protein [Tanacetum cinerariifolium]